MFKRRVGILGAVGVLALSILSGSALADETPAPAPDATIVCRTSDGQVVSFATVRAVKVETLKDGKVAISADEQGAPAEPGKLTRVERKPLSPEEEEKLAKALPEGAPRIEVKRAVPADEAGVVRIEEGAKVKVGGQVKEGETVDAVPAVPALPADGPDGAPPKGVTAPAATVTCKAGDK
ncbi:hypothetical protein [Nonomuraea roseoviolacea]|uniref:Uncharacterized protein n=1 Tax=Nonomuraea roseoviolacea subsp. carminata TaxID=160689 RepID=A0ABT1JZR0_9ACTN|nr:hypothetical protein [Nonomuraea roseoviolacea]MCP2347235.1 hypothetical protein [Nonomuraea roseoviolacea subsp. carminata]